MKFFYPFPTAFRRLFITVMIPHIISQGAPYNSRNVRLTCQVECDPLCSIEWLRDGNPIPKNSSNFVMLESVFPPRSAANLLLNVQSTLEMDFEHWPDGFLVPERDMANYTCVSTANELGNGVASSTLFRVHYPPKNISVTPV